MEMNATANPGPGPVPRRLAEGGVGVGAAGAGAGSAEVVLGGGEGPSIFLQPVSASEDAPVASPLRGGDKSPPSVHGGCSSHTPSLESGWVVG